MPSLESRGIRKLALVLDISPNTYFKSVGLTVFQNQAFAGDQSIEAVKVAEIFRQLFTEESGISLVDGSSNRELLLRNLQVSRWNGVASLKGSDEITSLLSELTSKGVDAILIVQEVDLPDFIGLTNQRLGPKGVYRRFGDVYIYGGFRIRAVSAKTGFEMEHTSYVQASARPLPNFVWRENFEAFNASEREVIAKGVDEIFRNNVREALVMIKATRSRN